MNDHIRRLMEQIRQLEEELSSEVREHEERVSSQLHERQAEFEESVRAAHRRLRTGLMRWFAGSQLRNMLSAPFIYGMLVPLLILDAFLALYQAACFPLYRIARPRRADFICLDRGRLEYLNIIERMNCNYCAYANGLFAYAREIAARTEQYWCPIKHARRRRGAHARYHRFLDFGDAEHYQAGADRLRVELTGETPED